VKKELTALCAGTDERHSKSIDERTKTGAAIGAGGGGFSLSERGLAGGGRACRDTGRAICWRARTLPTMATLVGAAFALCGAGKVG